MKYSILVFSYLILILFHFACGKEDNILNPSDEGRFLLENCDNGDNITSIGTYWYVQTDSARGGQSKVYISRATDNTLALTGEGYQSNASFMMKYRLSQGSYAFSPFVICGFNSNGLGISGSFGPQTPHMPANDCRHST